MATKQRCIRALEKHAFNAKLIHKDGALWGTELLAPPGMIWEGENHSHIVSAVVVRNKKSYWRHVLEEIKALPPAVHCSVETCCEWRNDGCTVWDE